MVLPDILADPDFLTKPPGTWFLALVFLLQYPGPGYIRKTADILFIGSKLSVPAQLHPPHWAPIPISWKSTCILGLLLTLMMLDITHPASNYEYILFIGGKIRNIPAGFPLTGVPPIFDLI